MSETPKFVLEAWLAFTGHGGYANPEVREAIRAVLAQLEQARIDRDEAISQCVSIGRESKKLEAEVERLERARLRSADWLTFEKMEAESDALRSTVHDLSVQIEEGGKEERALREIMRRLVHGIDKWNAGVEPIIGRAVDYKWLALEEARAAIAPEVKP